MDIINERFAMKKNAPPSGPVAQDLSQGCASAKSGAEVARRLANGVKVNVEDAGQNVEKRLGKRGTNVKKSMEHMGKLWEHYENYGKNMGKYGKPIENYGEIETMGKSRGKT